MKQQIQFIAILLAMMAGISVSAQSDHKLGGGSLSSGATGSTAASSGGMGAGKAVFQDIHFATENMDQWTIKNIAATSTTGQFVLATSNADRTQIIVELRDSKIIDMYSRSASGVLKVLEPTSAGCSNIHCTTNQVQHCFNQDGSCFCVCGAWIANYPGN